MKKNKLKNLLKFGILFFGVFISLTNCEKDNFKKLDYIEQHKHILKGFKIPTDSLFKVNKTLASKIKSKFNSNQNLKNRTITSDLGFSIDDSFVQKIVGDNYETFTFIVEREDSNPNILENYVLTLYDNNIYKQMLIQYPIIETSDGEKIYDIGNLTAQIFDDENLTQTTREASILCDVPHYTWDNGDGCVDFVCQNNGGPTHTVADGDKCSLWGKIYQATRECDTGAWVESDCLDGGGSSTSNSGDNNNAGSNTTSENDNTEEIPVIPLDELGELGIKRECGKINTLLNNPENSIFKQKLLNLANPSNYSDNLDIEFEKGISSHENETNVQENQGTDTTASVNLSYTITYPNKTKAIVHTHPNDSIGTYSIFSFDDLISFSKMLFNDKIDTGTFVAFLITKKGDSLTHYAMTINNKTKFKDFFYSFSPIFFSTATETDKEKRRRTEQKERELRIKYYDRPNAPLISHQNTNSELVLSQFLKLLDEADMGISLFNTDENFNNFTRVTFDENSPNNIKEKPCN